MIRLTLAWREALGSQSLPVDILVDSEICCAFPRLSFHNIFIIVVL
jgi:hypothetical protein